MTRFPGFLRLLHRACRPRLHRSFHSLLSSHSHLPSLPTLPQWHRTTNSNSVWMPAGLCIFAGGLGAYYQVLLAEPQHTDGLVLEEHEQHLPHSFISDLRAACNDDRVVLDPDERAFHGKPINSYHPVKHIPDAVVYPKTQKEVADIVKACNKYKIPVIPFGAATSIEGQTLTPHKGVCIDMSLMKAIKSLHVDDMDVVVEPGLGWMELNEFLRPYGLFFPLDPGPGASIGGMCATRCSGSLAVRYGTMKDNVLALKVTLANGDVLKTANRARKSAAGYDLTRLIIGSEGTLGVITEVTLRLQKLPESSIVAICSYPSVKDAADVAIATMHSGIQASRVELLDEVIIRAINHANGVHIKETPALMFEFVGTDASVREQTLRVQKISEGHGGSEFEYYDTEEGKEEVWKMRKEALWSCLAWIPNKEAMTTDVCVPLSRLADCISTSKEELDASPLTCGIVSHAGDGNFHAIIMFDPLNEDEEREADRLSDLMVHTALNMEGTCTGEHGVGTGKMKFMEAELGGETLKAMKAVKEALDPNCIMNPGKIIPHHICL